MPETKYINYQFQMKPDNKAFLEANAIHGRNARNDYFRNLGWETRQRFEQIMSEEFRPGYRADLGCDRCALEMIKILYTHFEEWKNAQTKEAVVLETEPLKVAANFPSNKVTHERSKKEKETEGPKN